MLGKRFAWFETDKEKENRTISELVRNRNCVPILNYTQNGENVHVYGKVVSLIIPRVGKNESFIVTIEDTTDQISLIFLGRKRILGISPGTVLEVRGRLNTSYYEDACMKKIFNPRYNIVPS